MSMVTEVKRTRAEAHDAMLQEALSRPGVREFMKVYEDWRKVDDAFDHYRQVLKQQARMATSNHTNTM